MEVLKDWEIKWEEEKKNLWSVVTSEGSFVCKKFKGRFFVKDCGDQLPVKGKVLASVKL